MHETLICVATPSGPLQLSVRTKTYLQALGHDRKSQVVICAAVHEKGMEQYGKDFPSLHWSNISMRSEKSNSAPAAIHFNPTEVRQRLIISRRRRLERLFPRLYDFEEYLPQNRIA